MFRYFTSTLFPLIKHHNSNNCESKKKDGKTHYQKFGVQSVGKNPNQYQVSSYVIRKFTDYCTLYYIPILFQDLSNMFRILYSLYSQKYIVLPTDKLAIAPSTYHIRLPMISEVSEQTKHKYNDLITVAILAWWMKGSSL